MVSLLVKLFSDCVVWVCVLIVLFVSLFVLLVVVGFLFITH